MSGMHRRCLRFRFFGIERKGLYEAIQSAPDILFVCSAGNSDSNNGFNEDIPSSFKLPNLLTVGAVDQAGDEASFTSYGDTVVVDANGYQVESYLPDGVRVRFSGTSMASPNVTNLAAKLLALDPSLKPDEVIALIRDGATASEDGRHLIDPTRSMELTGEADGNAEGRRIGAPGVQRNEGSGVRRRANNGSRHIGLSSSYNCHPA